MSGPVGRLVFDGDCGFCTRTVAWLRRRDRLQRIEVVPLQAPGAPESVGSSIAGCLDGVQWRGTDGQRRSGAGALNAALAAALGTHLPLTVYRATSVWQDRVYTWVAAHRHRLPGAVPHCSAHPADCAGSPVPTGAEHSRQ